MSAGVWRRPDDATWMLLDEATGLTLRKATTRERLLSHVMARSLDQRLAQGDSPDQDALLALRARMLLRPSTRRMLARSLARVLSDAEAPTPSWPRWCARVPVARRNVLEAADGLTTLIQVLARQAPLSPRGVAALELLLCDGAGPVYNPYCTERLEGVVEEVLQELEAVWH